MDFKQHYKIKLREWADSSLWEEELKRRGILFEKKEYFPGYVIYKIENPGDEILQEFSQRKEISKFGVMHHYFLNFQTRVMEVQMPSYEKVSGNKKYPMVGVLDNGIANIEMMSSWVYRDEKQYCPERQHPTHGSFVAGVILYGDEFSDKKWIAGEKIKIYDAAIVPDFSLYQLEEDELLFRLRRAVEEHSWIKIWNLAISLRFAVDLERISEFGLLLDYLQEKYNIIICKSCGNGEFTRDKEERGSILQGSDTIRSLVVASCNQEGEVSSFSLSGKGHKILEKPDIAMYGGDVFWDPNGKRKVSGVYSFSPKGEIVSSFGTSFATARMTSLLGNILFWKEDASALFLKAMVVQTASHGEKYFLGYGCPKDTNGIKKEYENSYVLEGTLLEEERITVGYKNGKIQCTLSSDVILDYHQEEDYVLCDINLSFEKNGKKYEKKNIFGEYEKLNNLKKYEILMEEEEGEIEIIFSKRWKKEKDKKKDRGLSYCFILRK